MLDKFAALLGIRPDQAEDALYSERAARHVVSRRSFFGAAGALATGAAFSFGGLEIADAATRLPGTLYVGRGGSDSNDGLSWATRKLTIGGVAPVPGDLIMVGPGPIDINCAVDRVMMIGQPVFRDGARITNSVFLTNKEARPLT